jgi:hypothetical protein
MAVCPSLNFFPHDTFKAASQLEENVKSEIEQMNIDNEPDDFPENLKNVLDPLFHYLCSFGQYHFSHQSKNISLGKMHFCELPNLCYSTIRIWKHDGRSTQGTDWASQKLSTYR